MLPAAQDLSVGTMLLMAQLDATEFSAVVAAVTSAFGDPTRRKVYLYVRESPAGVTASQVAQRFSLHPNVARHHLDKLTRGGYLDVFSTRTQLAGVGRPSKRYRPGTRAPVPTAPVPASAGSDGDLLVALLGGALSLLPPNAAEEMAEHVGFAYGSKLAGSMAIEDSQTSLRPALQAVADALTAHGFAAHAESRGRSLALIKDSCPFFDTAMQHPVICAVDRGMVKGMLSALCGPGSEQTEWSSRALGDKTCVTRLLPSA